ALEPQAAPRLEVQRSIFSCPVALSSLNLWEPDLIRQANGAARVAYRGKDNCYHHLNALLARPPSSPVATADEFASLIDGKDEKSLVLDAPQPSPWVSQYPLQE